MKQCSLFFAIVLLTVSVTAQINPTATGNKTNAKAQFELGNYKFALDEYLVYLKKNAWDEASTYHSAVCYMNLYLDKTKALSLLTGLIKGDEQRAQLWYDMGRSYMYSNMFDEAIMSFEQYIVLAEKAKQTDPNLIPAKRRIEMCKTAIDLINKPVNVNFVNLGKSINTVFPEFNPYISADGKVLVLTSQNDKTKGQTLDYDGFYSADVYVANFLNNVWTKPKEGIQALNTELSESCVGMSNSGEDLFVIADNETYDAELLLSSKKLSTKTYPTPIRVFSTFGTEDRYHSACLTPDKKRIFFSATKKGSKFGGKDIYTARKDPSGKWFDFQILDSTINTKYNEDFPVLSNDGQTLYFSSAGHNSIGDMDIFKSAWDTTKEKWSEPINLGYPLNNTDDNHLITFVNGGRYGYMARTEKNGIGDRDIYLVIFNDVPPPKVAVHGTILNQDNINIYKTDLKKLYLSNPGKNIIKVEIELTFTNKETKEQTTGIMPNSATGVYTVQLIPGTYEVSYKAPGFVQKTDELVIPDIPLAKPEIGKSFVLQLNKK